MRKIKEIICNALSHFSSLCKKVDEGTASGEESLAFGCLYIIVTCVVMLITIVAVTLFNLIIRII